MSIQPLNRGDFYFDSILNAILSADGTINTFDCHEFTMVWPSYTALDLPDTSVSRLTPCHFDMWTNEVEYYDSINQQIVRINLMSGKQTCISTSPSIQTTPSPQKNWGWPEEPKPIKNTDPFPKNAVLFHKSSRTKWIYNMRDPVTNNYVLLSFYDKNQATQIFDKDLPEFEEVFF